MQQMCLSHGAWRVCVLVAFPCGNRMFNLAHNLASKEWGDADSIDKKNQKSVQRITSNLETKNKSLLATVTKQEKQLTHLRDQSETKKKMFATEITQLREKMQEADKEKRRLNTQLMQTKTSAADLNAKVAQLASEKDQLSTTLKSSTADLTEKLGQFQKKSKTLQKELSVTEEKLSKALSKSNSNLIDDDDDANDAGGCSGDEDEDNTTDVPLVPHSENSTASNQQDAQQNRTDGSSGSGVQQPDGDTDDHGDGSANKNGSDVDEDVTAEDAAFVLMSLRETGIADIELEMQEMWMIKRVDFSKRFKPLWTVHAFKDSAYTVNVSKTKADGHPVPNAGGLFGKSACFFSNIIDAYTTCVQQGAPPVPKPNPKAKMGSQVMLHHKITFDVVCSFVDTTIIDVVGHAGDMHTKKNPKVVLVRASDHVDIPVYACFDTKEAVPAMVVRICATDKRRPMQSSVTITEMDWWSGALQQKYVCFSCCVVLQLAFLVLQLAILFIICICRDMRLHATPRSERLGAAQFHSFIYPPPLSLSLSLSLSFFLSLSVCVCVCVCARAHVIVESGMSRACH